MVRSDRPAPDQHSGMHVNEAARAGELCLSRNVHTCHHAHGGIVTKPVIIKACCLRPVRGLTCFI